MTSPIGLPPPDRRIGSERRANDGRRKDRLRAKLVNGESRYLDRRRGPWHLMGSPYLTDRRYPPSVIDGYVGHDDRRKQQRWFW